MSVNLALLQLCFDDSEFINNNTSSSDSPAAKKKLTASGKQTSVAAVTKTPAPAGGSSGAFDPAVFVVNKLDHVAPPTLSADLRTYRDYLQEGVIRCVHESVYQSFIDVSGQLTTAEPNIRGVSGPLQSLCDQTEDDKEVLEAARNKGLEELANARRHELSRRFYSTVLEVLLLQDRIEVLLAKDQDAEGEQEDAAASSSPSDANNNEQKFASLIRADGLKKTGSSNSSSASSSHSANNNNNTAVLHQVCACMQRLYTLRATLYQTCVTDDAKSELSGVEGDILAAEASVQDFLWSKFRALVATSSLSSCTSSALASVSAINKKKNAADDGDGNGDDNAAAPLVAIGKMFVLLGWENVFCTRFRETVVRPVIEEAVTWQAATAAKQRDGAEAVLNKLERVLTTYLLPIVAALRPTFAAEGHNSIAATIAAAPAAASSTTATSTSTSMAASTATTAVAGVSPLLAYGVWPAVCELVLKRLQFLFAQTDSYHRHYRLGNKLLGLIEEECATLEELHLLRSGKETALWVHKWNVDVYHTVRQREATERLSHITSLPLDSPSASSLPSNSTGSSSSGSASSSSSSASASSSQHSSPSCCSLKIFADVFSLIQWLLDPEEVFIYPLRHKLYRDVAGIIFTLIDCVKKKLTTQQQQQQQQGGRSSVVGSNNSGNGSGSGGSQPPQLSLLVYSNLLAFTHQVREKLLAASPSDTTDGTDTDTEGATGSNSSNRSNNANGGGGGGGGESAGLEQFATILLKALQDTTAHVRHITADGIVESTLKRLDVNAVTAQYTVVAKDKAMPTQPSAYLEGALDGVKSFQVEASSFLDDSSSVSTSSSNSNSDPTATSESDVSAMVTKILTEICRRLYDNIRNIVATARKKNDALLRLKAGKGGGGGGGGKNEAGGGGGSSNNKTEADKIDKMLIQFYLDCKEFGRLLSQFVGAGGGGDEGAGGPSSSSVHSTASASSFAPYRKLISLLEGRAQWILGGFVGAEPPELNEDAADDDDDDNRDGGVGENQ